MRLADKPEQRGPRRDRPRDDRGRRPQRPAPATGGGAMADALRRAGLTGE
jgi:hypothetical protein